MDRGAWWAIVSGVPKDWTKDTKWQLKEMQTVFMCTYVYTYMCKYVYFQAMNNSDLKILYPYNLKKRGDKCPFLIRLAKIF